MRNADILIVDDTPENLMVLEGILRKAGYDVRAAISGAIALKAVQNRQPDLILLDIMMPDMDGFEVCARLKENQKTCDIPVFFLTGLSAAEDERKGLELGAVDYIVKPFKEELLKARLRNQLELKQYRDHLEELVSERTASLIEANDLLTQQMDQLKQANQRAESADRAKSAFIAIISHELRTPLIPVIGFTELMRNGEFGEINEKQHNFLDSVLQNSRHLLSLINTIIEYARLEADRGNLLQSDVVLNRLVAQSLDTVRKQADTKGVQLQETISSDLPPGFKGDLSRLKKVLVNLLENAISFTPAGGTVTIAAASAPFDPLQLPHRHELPVPDFCLKLSIIDTGTGIKPEDYERIFEPFVQSEHFMTRNHEGIGLGLSLCRALIEQYGGAIWCDSEGTGNGSAFHILLPLVV